MTWRYILAALVALLLWAVPSAIIVFEARRTARAAEDERRRAG